MGRYVPRSGWAEKKLHAKAAAEKQQSITLVNQSFEERKIVVLRSDASDKTAKQDESDDHFRLAENSGVKSPAYLIGREPVMRMSTRRLLRRFREVTIPRPPR